MNEKKILIVTIVCLVLIVLSGGAGVYYFQFQQLPELKKKLAEVRAQLKAAEDKVAKIEDLKKEIKTLTEIEKEKLKQIPNLDFKTEYDAFADRLDQLRRKSGVSVPRAGWINATRPAPVSNRPPRVQPVTMHRVQYDLNVEGGFYQLLRFINLIEQQTRFIAVDNFTVTPGTEPARSPGTKGPTSYKRALKVVIYSFTYKLPEPKEHIVTGETHQYGKTHEPPE